MARKTIYLGPRLKRLRQELGLRQADMAADLELSPSYIALMERNQRPVTAETLLKLATTYAIDIADLAHDDSEEVSARLQAVLRDPIFANIALPKMDIDDISASYPEFAEALMRLHSAFNEEQMALAEKRGKSEIEGETDSSDPVAEARAFLAARRNYFPDLDESASALGRELRHCPDLEQHLAQKHDLEVRYEDAAILRGAQRWHDYHRRRVLVAEELGNSGRRYQLAFQLAILEQGETIEALLEEGRFSSDEARQLGLRALLSYWAAAVLMPYEKFVKSAQSTRYDLELLAARFGVSFEQVAHRLTTLQRPGMEGVPFFFLRVDQAGNISKRLDGAGFPLARYGGGCPLWNIHQAFDYPGQVQSQLIELPDGDSYVSIARTVTAGSGTFGAQQVMRTVALACSAEHLEKLIYADQLRTHPATQIGVSCRICHRPNCKARSAPPIGREIISNRFRETGIPFAF